MIKEQNKNKMTPFFKVIHAHLPFAANIFQKTTTKYNLPKNDFKFD